MTIPIDTNHPKVYFYYMDLDTRLRMAGLTPKLIETTLFVCKGLSNNEICNITGLSLPTIKSRLKKIFKCLNVRSRSQLIYSCYTWRHFERSS